ncbi:AaceriAGL015Wp [[Ashbya] aceris (nom. inval.)]|nr:AaceriAGL015Wp [[Ashbya] aceris (nom. inval.)]
MSCSKDFYFGLLRVSMIQLLKAHGFDRARPSTVDMFTDLYVRFLGLLASELQRLASARQQQDDTVCLQDLTLALQNLGLIRPVDVLDVYDENPALPGDEGVQRLKNWAVHDAAAVDARLVATPTPELLRVREGGGGKAGSKPLSLIPEYINQLNSGKKNEEEEREETELVEAMINNGDMDDWVRFMVTRQRVHALRKLSGKMPRDLESLPTIPGLKNSVLGRGRGSTNPEHLPAEVIDEQNQELRSHAAELASRLPASNKDNRLDAISLSFEEDPAYAPDTMSLDGAIMDLDYLDDAVLEEEFGDHYKDFNEFESLEVADALKMTDADLELGDYEDIRDAFNNGDSPTYDTGI